MKARKFLKNVKDWFEILKDWIQLLGAATWEPKILMDEYFDKRLRFQNSTGWYFPFPSILFGVIPLERRIIQNRIRKEIKAIKRMQTPSDKLDSLYHMMTMSCVNKTTVVDPGRFSRMLESIKVEFLTKRKSVDLYKLGIKMSTIEAKIQVLF